MDRKAKRLYADKWMRGKLAGCAVLLLLAGLAGFGCSEEDDLKREAEKFRKNTASKREVNDCISNMKLFCYGTPGIVEEKKCIPTAKEFEKIIGRPMVCPGSGKPYRYWGNGQKVKDPYSLHPELILLMCEHHKDVVICGQFAGPVMAEPKDKFKLDTRSHFLPIPER